MKSLHYIVEAFTFYMDLVSRLRFSIHWRVTDLVQVLLPMIRLS